jgi:hypothetical protein
MGAGFDTPECEECGHISQEHFQAFLEFTLKKARPTGGPLSIYLASPYSAASRQEERERFVMVAGMAGVLLLKGHIVYSPIAHSHPIRQACPDVSGNWEFWETIDRFFIGAMEALVVLRLHGWRESTGVTDELEIAKTLGKKIGYIDNGGTEIEWETALRTEQTEQTG